MGKDQECDLRSRDHVNLMLAFWINAGDSSTEYPSLHSSTGRLREEKQSGRFRGLFFR